MINFDEEINRINTNSSKYDNMKKIYGIAPKGALAMWTADMDFKAPECVIEAVKELYTHGIFGYYGNQESYNSAVEKWYLTRHNWKIDEDSMSVVHGIVAGIGMAIQAFSNPGDGVIVFTPVYHSFLSMIKKNGRKLLEYPLVIENKNYFIDFEQLEKSVNGNAKILLFCSPHNPGGKVWSKEELIKLANFCEKKNLILISDEIHNDLVYGQNKHVMFPVAAPHITNRLVVLVSSSKTFNIAGGLMGNVIIQDPNLRKKFKKIHQSIGTSPNLFGIKIAERAYAEGSQWLDQLLIYLEGNTSVFDKGIRNIPGLQSMKLHATYLAWVSFKNLGISEKEIVKRIHKDARIVASIGSS